MDFALTSITSPARHALVDYGVAATFLSLGFKYRGRNNAASALAFISGGIVLALSLISFETPRTAPRRSGGVAL